MGSKIEEHIRQQGYDASSSTVRNYIAEWKKRNKTSDNLYKVATQSNTNIIKIKRSTILNMLFKPLNTIKGIHNNTLELLFKQYPFIQQTLNLVTRFKEIVISNNANALIKWIADVRETNISEMISFANGLERDYTAVINAIRLPYSNGLAEGKINKLKVIKRIMYGRCGFDSLKNKIIGVENIQ